METLLIIVIILATFAGITVHKIIKIKADLRKLQQSAQVQINEIENATRIIEDDMWLTSSMVSMQQCKQMQ